MAWRYRLAARMVRGVELAIVSVAASFRHNATCVVHAAGFSVPIATAVKVQPS